MSLKTRLKLWHYTRQMRKHEALADRHGRTCGAMHRAAMEERVLEIRENRKAAHYHGLIRELR